MQEPRALYQDLPLGRLESVQGLVQLENEPGRFLVIAEAQRTREAPPHATEVPRRQGLGLPRALGRSGLRHAAVVLQDRAAYLVVAEVVLHLGVTDELVDQLHINLEIRAQLVHGLEAGDLFDHILVLEHRQEGHHRPLRFRQVLEDGLLAIVQAVRYRLADESVLVPFVLDQVHPAEQLQLGPRDSLRFVHAAVPGETQKEQHHVLVHERSHPGAEVVPGDFPRNLFRQHFDVFCRCFSRIVLLSSLVLAGAFLPHGRGQGRSGVGAKPLSCGTQVLNLSQNGLSSKLIR
mmetsp:Transcript_51686/g.157045  ORF Transcript_51686/g.157045 Transcript_51686/m.157045 type:complete len:291 (-) Transcript_51686:2-874(-)